MDIPAKKLANLANLKRLLIFAPSMALYLTTEFFRDLIKLFSPAYAEKFFRLGPTPQPFFVINAYLIFVILDALFVLSFLLEQEKNLKTNNGIIFTFRLFRFTDFL